jgi:hypothetical protein
MFSTILAPLLETPGAVAAAFYDPQGQAIADAGDRGAVEVLGTYHSVWFGELTRAAESSGLGGLREVAIDFGERRVVSTLVAEGYYLVVVFERHAIPARGREAFVEASRRLAAEVA